MGNANPSANIGQGAAGQEPRDVPCNSCPSCYETAHDGSQEVETSKLGTLHTLHTAPVFSMRPGQQPARDATEEAQEMMYRECSDEAKLETFNGRSTAEYHDLRAAEGDDPITSARSAPASIGPGPASSREGAVVATTTAGPPTVDAEDVDDADDDASQWSLVSETVIKLNTDHKVADPGKGASKPLSSKRKPQEPEEDADFDGFQEAGTLDDDSKSKTAL